MISGVAAFVGAMLGSIVINFIFSLTDPYEDDFDEDKE